MNISQRIGVALCVRTEIEPDVGDAGRLRRYALTHLVIPMGISRKILDAVGKVATSIRSCSKKDVHRFFKTKKFVGVSMSLKLANPAGGYVTGSVNIILESSAWV